MKKAQLTINLSALTYNTKLALEKGNQSLFANVSHNASHLGLKHVVRTLYNCGIRAFTTHILSEARDIREWYDDVTILYTSTTTDFETLRHYRIDGIVSSYDFIKAYNKYMNGISWHIQWAGTSLIGCKTHKELLETLKHALENDLQIVGLCTLLPAVSSLEQYQQAKETWYAVIDLMTQFQSFHFIHAQTSNSFHHENGLLNKHTHSRLGHFLYGNVKDAHLANVVSLKANVCHITQLAVGEQLHDFVATTPTRIAIVNIGYTNGLLREQMIKSSVMINDKLYTCIGLTAYEMMVHVDEYVDFGHSVTIYDQKLPLYEKTTHAHTATQQLSTLNHDTLLVNYII